MSIFNTIIIVITIILIVFLCVENYCRYHNKSLLETVRPEWFEDVTKFPYDSFPCKVNSDQYNSTIEKGFQKMKNTRIVISGLCINIEKNITKLIKKIEQLGSYFKDYQLVIFENDSNDNTRELLLEWSKNNKHIHLIECIEDQNCKLKTKGAIEHGIESDQRMRKMANYRNRVLRYIYDHFIDYDCVFSMDLDTRGPLSIKGVAHSFGLYEEWDSVSSMGLNGMTLTASIPLYYDILAYQDNDYDYEKNFLDIIGISYRANKKVGSDLIPVLSGFAGLAIYKMDIIRKGINYIPEDGKYVCEHKIFHNNMRKNGFSRIFINPNMIFLVGLQGDYKKYPFH